MNRNLDGVYFRVKRDDKYQNICFTDLTEEETEEVLNGKSDAWLWSLLAIMFGVYRNIKKQLSAAELEQARKSMIEYWYCSTIKDELLAIKYDILCMANIAGLVNKNIEREEE